MFNLLDHSAHQTSPYSVTGSRAFRIPGQLVDLDAGFVDEAKVDMHLEVVVDVFELVDEAIAGELGGKILKGAISIATAESTLDVEEGD